MEDKRIELLKFLIKTSEVILSQREEGLFEMGVIAAYKGRIRTYKHMILKIQRENNELPPLADLD